MKQRYLPEGSRLTTAENREAVRTLNHLEHAMHAGTVLEGTATLCDSSLCLHVPLPCADGIIPPEEAVLCRSGERRKDIAVLSRVGKPVAFRVLSIRSEGDRIVAILSRRLAQEDCLRHLMDTLSEGDLLQAKVTHLEAFGAFLDIGCGLSSLLSVDCISVSRISHPRDRLFCGMPLVIAVKAIERETGRIYATLRELLGTWEENVARFSVGQTVAGILRSVESYGIFIELAPNLAGLAECKPEQAEEMRQKIGQSAAVYIKSIVPDRMKVKLVLIDTAVLPPTEKKLLYFVDPKKTEHLSRWRYSPLSAAKQIETVFQTIDQKAGSSANHAESGS